MIAAAAHAYIDQGLSIVPLNAGAKTPIGRWRRWMRQRMSHQEAESWWGAFRPEPNIGVITGEISGSLNVIDIEPEHVAFVREAVRLPETPSVVTARGGLHLYCRGERPCGKARIEDRIIGDVRGNGGYVVAPPSRIGDGAYFGAIDSNQLAPIPGWLAELRRRRSPPSVPARWAIDDLETWLPAHMVEMLAGWRPGGCCTSPSELELAVICACVRVGATRESTIGMLGRFPISENMLMHLRRDASYFDRTYDQAVFEIENEREQGVPMRCIRVRVFQGRIRGGARLRAEVLYATSDARVTYTVPVLLGRPPRENEIAGEWRALAHVYGKEPVPDATIFDGREVYGVCKQGRVTHIWGDQ